MSDTLIISPERARRILSRLAYEVVEHNRGAETLAVVGIRRRGAVVAAALADQIRKIEDSTDLVTWDLDVTPYRDDRAADAPPPEPPDVALNVTGSDVILVDDVLFTGRTVRAALDAIVHYGRPRSIQLVVLIDRGHREYPIQPDYVGRVLPTKHRERVRVDVDSDFAVYVVEE